MKKIPKLPKVPEQSDLRPEKNLDDWEAKAWVYFIWVVIVDRVYLKIGYSRSPFFRYEQLLAGIPEKPYQMFLLSCLNVEQARLFEGMFHRQMLDYRTRGEWYTHPNIKRFYKTLHGKMEEIFTLFRVFDYEPKLEAIDLDGYRPVLYKNGYISHFEDSNTEASRDGT